MKRFFVLILVLALLLTGCMSSQIPATDDPRPSETEATDPTETEATDPAPTDPTGPAPPDPPADPTDPTEPSDPSDPTEPKEVLFYAHYIDVGQADCALLKLGDCDILIDGGNVADGTDVVSYLRNQNVDDIELMICTHADEDHVGGLTEVLNAFAVEEVWTSSVSKSTKRSEEHV